MCTKSFIFYCVNAQTICIPSKSNLPAYSTRLRRKNDEVNACRRRPVRDTDCSLMRSCEGCALQELSWLVVRLILRLAVVVVVVTSSVGGARTTMIEWVDDRLATVRTGDTFPVDDMDARAAAADAELDDRDEDRRRFCSSNCVKRLSLFMMAIYAGRLCGILYPISWPWL